MLQQPVLKDNQSIQKFSFFGTLLKKIIPTALGKLNNKMYKWFLFIRNLVKILRSCKKVAKLCSVHNLWHYRKGLQLGRLTETFANYLEQVFLYLTEMVPFTASEIQKISKAEI